MSLPPVQCAEQVVVTPPAAWPGVAAQAREALRWCREAAQILPEMMGEMA